MEYTTKFTDLRDNILIEYLTYKRNFLKNEDELNKIDMILKDLDTKKSKSITEEENEHNNFLNKISGEFKKYSLFKPWNRLSQEQKTNQLMIYLNSLIEASNINEIKKILLEYNKNGVLSNRYVKYDSKIAKIVGIKTLEYDNNLNVYNLQINLKKTLSI